MNRRILCIVLTIILFCTGCVSQSEYDDLQQENHDLQNEVEDLTEDYEAQIRQLLNDLNKTRSEVERITGENAELKHSNALLVDERDQKAKELKESESALSSLQEQYDQLLNGASYRLIEIRNLFEEKKYSQVITKASELHKLYNGTSEDDEAMALAKQAQDILDAEEQARLEEEKRKEEEAKKTAQEKARAILRITDLHTGKPNSAGGVDLYIDYVNNSDKTIKYITFTVVPYNAVGDRVYCEIRDYSYFNGQSTGPFAPGEVVDDRYWDCAWYNSTIKTAVLTRIEIEYMDGTWVVLTGDDLEYVQY